MFLCMGEIKFFQNHKLAPAILEALATFSSSTYPNLLSTISSNSATS